MSLKHFTLFCFLAFTSAFADAADFIPTAEDIEAVDLKTGAYFAALDTEKYEVAYAMLTPSMKQLMNFEQWTSLKKKSNADLGDLLNRTRTKVTWYKDPQDAPAPGLYVAVDSKSNYQNADMHSEYVIWYRFNEKEEFKQMRHEVTFMLKDDSSSNKAKAPAPLKESGSADIGYGTVEEARTALSADPANIATKMGDGWLIVEEPKANAFWSFSPPGHPAYPAVVKRVPVEKDGGVFLSMNVICQAKKAACDQLVRDFQQLNEKMTSEFGKKK